ncbi:MAG TPA: sulfatase-like hydrolase/transferase [Blastocatellia bacterium]|nr:sulfatase-like hydrolase/transferase [Blastocatellia bacterium]
MRARSSRPAAVWAAFILSVLVIVVAYPLAKPSRVHSRKLKNQSPNILIIMTDDQGHDTLTSQFMPTTKALIADQGITFTRAYIPTPICCASRAGFLTGKYARNNGVHVNKDHLAGPTLVNRLHDAGYYTGLSGKYLNSWSADPRPEFDFWVGWKRDLIDPYMNISGEFKTVPGYMPYIIRDSALDFLDRVPADQPFFLMFTPVTPHTPAIPAPGDENLYSGLAPWRPPNFNPAQMAGKPDWLQKLPQLTADEIKDLDESRLDQLRCLRPIDNGVRDLLQKLRDQGKLDNTLVVFYSDNGAFWGEHRIHGKNRVYEEACRVPFALRYPPLIDVPHVENRLVAVIDLAPTIYELSGIPIPSDVDGRSLVPLMRGTPDWRDALLIEGWPGSFIHDNGDPVDRSNRMNTETTEHFRAIRTEQFVYVKTDKDSSELYDTDADPYELNNLIDDPRFSSTVKKLKKRLKRGPF